MHLPSPLVPLWRSGAVSITCPAGLGDRTISGCGGTSGQRQQRCRAVSITCPAGQAIEPSAAEEGLLARGNHKAEQPCRTRRSNHQRLRRDFWPEAATMQSKLYDTTGDRQLRSAPLLVSQCSHIASCTIPQATDSFVQHHYWSPSAVTGERK